MCTDEEVVDVAGPRLSAAMSSWEYLLLRVQQEDEGNSSAPLIPRILNEMTSLLDRVSSMAARHLHVHRSACDGTEEHEPYQLTNPETARLIGMPCGTYFISKDERKLLEEDAAESAHLSSESAQQQPTVSSSNTSTSSVTITPVNPVPTLVTLVPQVVSNEQQQQQQHQQQEPEVVTEDDSHMKVDSAAAAASKLWEELEEAAHLPTSADGESGAGGDGDNVDDDAVESELMQVDEIVNQVVEDQTGSQAPSPL